MFLIPLEVKVRDQNGNVLVGAAVFLGVTAGGLAPETFTAEALTAADVNASVYPGRVN